MSQGLPGGLVGRGQRTRVSRIVAGGRMPGLDTYRRIRELYGWPQTFA